VHLLGNWSAVQRSPAQNLLGDDCVAGGELFGFDDVAKAPVVDGNVVADRSVGSLAFSVQNLTCLSHTEEGFRLQVLEDPRLVRNLRELRLDEINRPRRPEVSADGNTVGVDFESQIVPGQRNGLTVPLPGWSRLHEARSAASHWG